MIEIALYVVGICGVIGLGCFISWALDRTNIKNNYHNNVTADDLAELSRLFDEDNSFVGHNDKGEKFLCGYLKD